MRENISSIINETFGRLILDSSERIFRAQRKRRNFKIWLATLLVFAIAASFTFYSVFVKADVFSYFPLSCLGNWDNPQYAEGEPTLSPDTSLGQFTKNNSAFFGGGTRQIFCGGFRNDVDVADKIFQKAVLKFSWVFALPLSPSISSPSVLEQSEYDQQIIDLPASSSITVIPDQNASSSSLETSVFPSPQDSLEPSVIPTIQPTITPPLPSLTASASPEPELTPEITEVEPTVEVQPPTESPIPELTPEPTPAPTPTELPSSLNFLNKLFAFRDLEVLASSSADTPNDIASRNMSQTASLGQFLDDFLEILYTTDGQNWLLLARVNENNFGSLELELPVSSWGELENLQISLRGLGTSDLEKQIYLDGMRIEAEYGEIEAALKQEDVEARLERAKNQGTIKIEKEKVFRQRENKTDFRADEEPVFEINTDFPIPASISPIPSSLLRKSDFNSFLSWFTPLEVASPRSSGLAPLARVRLLTGLKKILKPEFANAQQLADQVLAEVFDSRGQKSNIEAVVQDAGGKTTVRLVKERAFKPGRYELRVVIIKNGEAYVTSQDFTWGVLAINVNKSVSLPGEELYLQMGVLDSVGETLCDADLILEITDPLGIKKIFRTPEKGAETPNKNFIYRSTECRGNNVTDIPDYSAYYPTTVAGKYAMSLVNLDNQFRISDSFEVREPVSFEIERMSATRINPYQANYTMTMRVKANSDFTGSITETIPKEFQLIAGSGVQTVQNYDKEQKLIWKVSIKKGQMIELKYEYDAPNVSPQLYLLGPAVVGREDGSFLFQESRQWQLASDVDTVVFLTVMDASPWTVPADWNNASNSIEVIGAGGGGGDSNQNAGSGGGGGGGYAKVTNLTLTGSITFSVGASGSGGSGGNGGNTWFNAATFADCTDNNVCAKAEGGEGGGGAIGAGGLGGATASATGDVGLIFAGGNGGGGSGTDGSGGGGGAAGRGGAGKNAITVGVFTTGSGGGGAGGGSATDGSAATSTTGGNGGTGYTGGAGGAGGNNATCASGGNGAAGVNVGSGGGGGDTACNGGAGANGQQWDSTHGSGGGGGGAGDSASVTGGNGGKYGGGGGGAGGNSASTGRGGDGLIVIKYAPSVVATITLTLDAGGVTALGTLTSGIRKTATTRLKATQTGASSLTITAGRLRAITNVTLASNAVPLVTANQISDTVGGIDVFSSIANCTAGGGDDPATWGTGVSTGLGFSNWAASSGKDTTCWGTGITETDALNKYAALQASASASSFINIAASPPATLYTSIGYSLDVSSTQKATTYNGGVVFTATVSP